MPDAKPKNSEVTKKIVDIKSDGDGATGTSRPVIVTNRAILKDPMMAEVSQLTGGLEAEPKAPTIAELAAKKKDTASDASGAPEISVVKKQPIRSDDDASTADTSKEKPSVAPSKKKIIIKPLGTESDEKPATGTTPKPKTKKQPTIADLAKPDPLPNVDISPEDIEVTAVDDDLEEPSPTAEFSDEPAATTNEKSAPKSKSDSAAPVQPGRSFDEVPTDTASSLSSADGENGGLDEKGNAKQKKKKSGELTTDQQKAIETEEYFLPITTAETKRMRREILFATLFVTVLIVVWLNIMLDAGLLQLGGLKAVTNFF